MRTAWFFSTLPNVLCLLHLSIYVRPAALSSFPNVPKVLLYITPFPQFHNKPTILDLCAKQLAKSICQMRTVLVVFGIKIIEGLEGHAENCSNSYSDSNQFISSLMIPEMDFSNLCFILISLSEPSLYKHTSRRCPTSTITSWDQKKLLNVGCSEDTVLMELVLPRESHTQTCSRKWTKCVFKHQKKRNRNETIG